MEQELYKPFKSKAKFKKYSVYVMKDGKKTLIHFGDARFSQYKDKLGFYAELDHNDKDRRDRYLKRAKGIKNKEGELAWKDKNSANYWAIKKLWSD